MSMKSLVAAAALIAIPVILHAQHEGHGGHDMAAMAAEAAPKESGQAAFGAIGEIVAMLAADPRTDWSKVDVDALRTHLVDMDNVTLHARVASTPVPGGMRFDIAGEGPVRDSIRRMSAAHAASVEASEGRKVKVAETPAGAAMTVTSADPAAAARIRALGFFGEMTLGAHHQTHHLMMARGEMHH
jgi:hypothetical protein